LVIIDFLSEFVIFCKQICGKSIQHKLLSNNKWINWSINIAEHSNCIVSMEVWFLFPWGLGTSIMSSCRVLSWEHNRHCSSGNVPALDRQAHVWPVLAMQWPASTLQCWKLNQFNVLT